MSTSSTSLFDSLPARPPTPPREIAKAIDDAISFLDDSNEIEQLISKSGLASRNVNASEATPSSSQDTTSLSALTKKVGFSPNPVYFKISRPDQSSSPAARLLKRSPSTAKDAKPLKSILKLSYAPPPSPEDLESKLNYFSPAEPGSFAKMLQSVCQQLAGPSRAERLDAYLALNGTLQAYENVPDATAMLQKMRLLMQFLSRDIVWKDATEKLDTQMVTQALRLTMSIVYSQTLSDGLDDDFRHFLIDRSINVLEQAEMPKQIIKSHMCLLYQQRFRTPAMNGGRAERILTALQTIEDRCSGNSVVGYRLMIYERLLEQAQPPMLSRARDWLEHIFHGMLSSIKDIRSRAIEACTKAGLLLGQQTHASTILCEMFETEVEEGQTYLDYFKLRLEQMMSDKDTGYQVPQIWSSVILFFRSKRRPMNKWSSYGSWLRILQRCLNASDLTVRYQATLAWNKLVFATMPGSSTTERQMSMLKTPIISALEKANADKSSKQYRQFALDSFDNLLHYGLRPGLSNEELDNAWNSFVEPVLSKLARSSGRARRHACSVLHGLLNGNPGVWNVNAALDAKPIKPENLPKLDPKWVRTRLARFLKVLEPMISQDTFYSEDESRAIDATWQSLMRAIADARSQEVRTTSELKEAIALLIAFFRRLWHGCNSTADRHRWINRYVSMLDAAMVGVGVSSFTEDILMTTTDDLIQVAPTPSHRGVKHNKTPTSPLAIIFGQFYRIPSGLAAGQTYFSSALTILERSLSVKVTAAASLELLSRSIHGWKSSCGQDAEPPIQRELWIVVAHAAIQALNAELNRSKGQEAQPLGLVLRSGLDILTDGLIFESHPRLSTTLSEFYDALSKNAKSCAGEGGIVLALMEPLAKVLMDMGPQIHVNVRVDVATTMLERSAWPKSRQSLEQSRKLLWGIGLTHVKTSLFNPFEHVYELIVSIMSEAYINFEGDQEPVVEALQSFFNSVINLLQSCPVSVLAIALRKMQSGFVLWVEDKQRKSSANVRVVELVQAGWQSIIRLLKTLPSRDSALLKALEPLLVAGFGSPHRTVVNQTIIYWNETFGFAESLDYPDELELVLRARLADADISLPAFPESDDDRIPATLPAFFDSQSSKDDRLYPSKLSGTPGKSLLSPMQGHGPRSIHGASKSSPITGNIASPSPARRVEQHSISLTPKPRLRHDDSQIQFAPIDSSPLPPADESQLLTEHQKEVKARQHLDAQLFPTFSSSPMARSTALPRVPPKKLDFGAKSNPFTGEGQQGTPTGLAVGNVLPSDDMPSSPTPSSTKDASQGVIDVSLDQEDEDDLDDPPSSPPRAAEDEDEEMVNRPEAAEGRDLKAVVVNNSELPDLQQDADNANDQRQAVSSKQGAEQPPSEADEMFSASEFPSNSVQPDEQLPLENEIAQNTQPVSTSQSQHISSKNLVNQDLGADEGTQDQATGEAGEDEEITRVDDSFVEAVSQNESQPQDDESSQRGSKKRKRKQSKNTVGKRQKQQSSMQRIWSTFSFGQQEDDDDMGDEIIVASSQPAPSPTVDKVVRGSNEPEKDAGDDGSGEDEVIVERSTIIKREPDVMQPPTKRGPGRPRESETPNFSQTEIVPKKALKRKASNISNASIESSQASVGRVEDPQAQNKKKGRGRPRRGSISQGSREPSRPDSSSSREAVAVLVSPKVRRIPSGDNITVATPERQAKEAAIVSDRPMLTPRSILARLKGALSDFRGMILGPKEEREFDDVLFELRKETHAAARRGAAN